jgi:hypothetical protein
MHEPRKSTGEIPLHADIVRDALHRLRQVPGKRAGDLFQEGCVVMALADEAGRQPKGAPERNVAYRELLEFQRKALAFLAQPEPE